MGGGFPDVPAGRRARELVAFLNGKGPGAESYVLEAAAASLLERRGVDGLAAAVSRLRDDLGGVRTLGFLATGPTRAILVLRPLGGQGGRAVVTLEIEEEPPHGIDGVDVRVE